MDVFGVLIKVYLLLPKLFILHSQQPQVIIYKVQLTMLHTVVLTMQYSNLAIWVATGLMYIQWWFIFSHTQVLTHLLCNLILILFRIKFYMLIYLFAQTTHKGQKHMAHATNLMVTDHLFNNLSLISNNWMFHQDWLIHHTIFIIHTLQLILLKANYSSN